MDTGKAQNKAVTVFVTKGDTNGIISLILRFLILILPHDDERESVLLEMTRFSLILSASYWDLFRKMIVPTDTFRPHSSGLGLG